MEMLDKIGPEIAPEEIHLYPGSRQSTNHSLLPFEPDTPDSCYIY